MRSIRKSKGLLAGIGALFLLGACNEPLAAPILGENSNEETPRRGGTIRLASYADMRALDPAVAGDTLAAIILQLLMDGLVEYDARGQIVPGLAERWDVLDGGLGYRFQLRQNVRFHDGEELTAEDVQRTVERSLHPSTPNPNGSMYESLVGFEDYTTGKNPHLAGVTVEGRYVVTFRLKQPDATFLPALAMASLRPACKSAGTRYVDTWHVCGTGPFRLPPNGWEKGMSIRVVRNESYFRPGLPYADGVLFTYNVNSVTQRFKFEKGELDILRDLTQADLFRFQSDSRWKPFGAFDTDRTTAGDGMNTRMKPFNNIELRRAVAAAIDRDHLRLIKSACMRPTGQLIPPATPFFNPNLREQKYDYAAALEHMRRAGYPYDPKTDEGGYPDVIPYSVYSQGLPEFVAQIVQQDLRKIGIRIELRLVSFAAWLALTHRPNQTPISFQIWQQDYPDPSSFFEPLFSTGAINDEDTNNTSFYSNPRLDEILVKARRELEPEKRQKLYDEAGDILIDEAPWSFSHTFHWFEVRQPYVRGYSPHPVWTLNVRESWVDRKKDSLASRPVSLFHGILASLFGTRSKAP